MSGIAGKARGPGHVIWLLPGQVYHQVAAGVWGSQVGPNDTVMLKLFLCTKPSA